MVEEEQSLKLDCDTAMGMKCQWHHFPGWGYEGGWPDLLIAVSVLITVELAKGHRLSRHLETDFCPGGDLNTWPLEWQSSMLTTRLSHLPW